jgi:hypothetical protein
MEHLESAGWLVFINNFYLIAREQITSFQFSLFGFKMLLLSVLIFIVLFVWLPFLRFNEFFLTLALERLSRN